MMEMNILVLGVNNWEFEGNSGSSIFYTATTQATEQGKNGLFPIKKTVDASIAASLAMIPLPSICKLKFEMKTTAGGKMDLDILKIEQVKHLEVK